MKKMAKTAHVFCEWPHSHVFVLFLFTIWHLNSSQCMFSSTRACADVFPRCSQCKLHVGRFSSGFTKCIASGKYNDRSFLKSFKG